MRSLRGNFAAEVMIERQFLRTGVLQRLASAAQPSKAACSRCMLVSTRVHCGRPLSDSDLTSTEPKSASPAAAVFPARTTSASVWAAAGRRMGADANTQTATAKPAISLRQRKFVTPVNRLRADHVRTVQGQVLHQ